MTTIPQSMASALARSTTTLCHAWRVTLTDGSRLGFTDHDRALTIDGLTFEPGSGMNASEARDTLGLAADSVEISGALSSDLIREEDLLSGRFDGATVETLLVDWSDPSANMLIRAATIGRISRADEAFAAELDSFARGFDQPQGRFFRRGCDAEVGDAQCGADLSLPAYAGSGTVTAGEVQGSISATGLETFGAGWFSGGMVRFKTAGRRRIIAHTRRGETDILTLADGPRTVAVGEAFTITAGCDKGFATCKAKFANSLNFRGFPHLPGNDAAYGYASEGVVFDGSPLVP